MLSWPDPLPRQLHWLRCLPVLRRQGLLEGFRVLRYLLLPVSPQVLWYHLLLQLNGDPAAPTRSGARRNVCSARCRSGGARRGRLISVGAVV